MQNLTDARNQKTRSVPDWWIAMLIMVIITVANSALIVGLLQMLSWQQCTFLVFSGVALAGGVVFTVSTMQRLGKGD